MISEFFTRPNHDFTRLGRVDGWLGRTLVSQFTDKNSKLMCHNLLIRIPNFDIISTDDLVMKGARASAAMLWDTAKIIVPRTLAYKT